MKMNFTYLNIAALRTVGIRQMPKTKDFSLTAFILFLSIFTLLTFKTYASDPDSLMATANNAYNEGRYDSAINVYHLIEKENLQSAGLFYNMGNAYFKNNDIASAILYYEKAKKLDHNNEDIEYNLRIANSMIVDKIDKVPELIFTKWWNYFYNMFNADTWTAFSLVSWAVLIFFVGLFILTGKRPVRKLAFYFGILFLFTSLATFGLASQKYYFGKEHKEAIIYTPTVTVKSSPTTNSVDLFVVHEGTKVRIQDEVNEWVKIKIPDGSVGWMPMSTLREI
jgi:tetratricopeptide (TPR) repeat protein